MVTSFLPASPEAGDAARRGPLGFAQERLWLHHRLRPDDPAYNIVAAVELEGPLAGLALEAAVVDAVRRHELLRTLLPAEGGRPAPVVVAAPRACVRRVDLAGLGAARAEAVARALLRRVAARPFVLAREPPAAWWLLRLAPDRHVLALAVHHVAFDAGSLALLWDELSRAAAEARAGRPPPAGRSPARYADLAARERARDPGAALERRRALLEDAPRALSPFAPGGAGHSGEAAGASHTHLALPPDAARRLRALARAERATPFMVVLAAVGALLARRTAEEVVVLGVPLSLRDSEEARSVVGPLMNLVPLPIDLQGDPSFAELVARVRAAALAAYEDRHVPFELLVAALAPDRRADRNPLFEVLVTQHEPVAPGELAGARARALEVPAAAAKYDLTVTARPAAGGLELAIEADAARGGPDGAEVVARELRTLLDHALADPAARVGRLPLLTGAERRRALAAGEGPRLGAALPSRSGPALASRLGPVLPPDPDPALPPIPRLVERRAAAAPDAVAIRGAGGSLTYGELNARANRLARLLRSRGVRCEHPVAVCVRRSPELVVALLAVLKAGGAYVPLDPAYPRDRLRFMVADSGARVVVADDSLPEGAAGDAAVVGLDAGADAADLPETPPPGSLAYVLYTSGSTGRPKGVAIEHRSASAFVAWALAEFTADELRCVAATTSVCFDLSVFELWVPLCAGSTVALARDPLDAAALRGVTLLNTVPSAASALLDTAGLPPSVTTVNLAGEPLPVDLAQRLHGRSVVNLYGPTEATTYATFERVPPGSAPTIGRPVAGARAIVAGGELEPAPDGVPGELLLGGDGLARGYAGRPALTAERFVPDPFGGRRGARLYRTGDLVRRRADGRLDYAGRRDDQVKVRGVRIELGEVEAALREHPAVADAAAAVTGDDPRRRRLVAFAVPAAGAPLDPQELLDHLHSRLHPAGVPTAVRTLPELPRGRTGKLDRRALERLASDADAGADSPPLVPPRTLREQAIAAAWRETLGHDRAGVHDPFFAVGGNSLLLLELHHRLVESGVAPGLPLTDLFERPTIAALARHLGDGAAPQRDPAPAFRGSRRRAALSRAAGRSDGRR